MQAVPTRRDGEFRYKNVAEVAKLWVSRTQLHRNSVEFRYKLAKLPFANFIITPLA